VPHGQWFRLTTGWRHGRWVVVKATGGPAAPELAGEARLLGALGHPGIVELVAHGAPGGGAGYEMATSLAGHHTLASATVTSLERALLTGGQLAATLAHLHARGVAHTRVDAGHVVVSPGGDVRLCGFRRACGATPGACHADVVAAAGLTRDLVDAATALPRHGPGWAGPGLARPVGSRSRRAVAADTREVLADPSLDAAGLARVLAGLLTRLGVERLQGVAAGGWRPRWPTGDRRE
jgi:hypothetical protein